ncbi:unnamed protein product [Protopolystoma xenopodis]|uniref:Uncharacterized protein n=1 Tax=Protopolystoma xenopodis TaxID=117903 RepID=A0A448WYG0_9PLAT|nr:unnamed protein product [Protopolystoma xenopodis]
MHVYQLNDLGNLQKGTGGDKEAVTRLTAHFDGWIKAIQLASSTCPSNKYRNCLYPSGQTFVAKAEPAGLGPTVLVLHNSYSNPHTSRLQPLDRGRRLAQVVPVSKSVSSRAGFALRHFGILSKPTQRKGRQFFVKANECIFVNLLLWKRVIWAFPRENASRSY